MKHFLYILALIFSLVANAQHIKNLTPANASQVESLVLTITAENTTFKSAPNTIKLVYSANPNVYQLATAVECINDTLLKAVFTFSSNNQIGAYDLVVTNQQTTTSIVLSKGFHIDPVIIPSSVLLSLSPDSAFQGERVEVTVKAKNTHFTHPVPIESHFARSNSGISSVSIKVISNEELKITFDVNYFDSVGYYDLTVYNSIDGSLKLKNAFKVNAGPFPPKLISVSPNTANKLGTVWVTIKGKNTFFKKDSNTVTLFRNFQSILTAEKVNYIDDTTMLAFFNFENGEAAAVYDIYVLPKSGYGNSLKLMQVFTLNDTLLPPSVVSFDPVSAYLGDSVTIAVRGKNTHFLRGWTNLTLREKGVGIGCYVHVINDSLLEGTVGFDYMNYPLTNYAVEISNQVDGVLTAADSFALKKPDNPPKIKSVTPNEATQGQRIDLLIKANKSTRFSANSVMPHLYNAKKEIRAKTYTIINDSTLLANFELGMDTTLIGTYDVKTSVYPNYNSYLTLPNGFTIKKNPSPGSLISITPSVATQFDTVSIAITGAKTHFLSGANVHLRNGNSLISANTITIVNDTLLKATFILNYNYYSSVQCDLIVSSWIDGNMEMKSAFTINRLYDHDPKILDIFPKEATQGQSITMNIKGSKKAFLPGNYDVKLFYYGNFNQIYSTAATAVNYINDSLLTASFLFNNLDKATNYYLKVTNKSSLLYTGGFTLKVVAVTDKLLAVSPAWASQTDTVTLAITGFNTHFDSADAVWLENRFGRKITPILTNIVNDTLTMAKFGFNGSHLPEAYSVHVRSAITNKTLTLKSVFTITGTINTSALLEVTPKNIYCYVNFKHTLEIRATNTHFLTEIDTIVFSNYQYSYDQHVVYPTGMQILDDSTISAGIVAKDYCGYYDIFVLGKKNYILQGKLIATPPISVEETLPDEDLVRIFPNPSTGLFTLEVKDNFKQAELCVFDIYGRIIFKNETIEASSQIDLSAFPSGMYFIKLVKNGVCKTEKIIKE